jgi:hypothetical protein
VEKMMEQARENVSAKKGGRGLRRWGSAMWWTVTSDSRCAVPIRLLPREVLYLTTCRLQHR